MKYGLPFLPQVMSKLAYSGSFRSKRTTLAFYVVSGQPRTHRPYQPRSNLGNCTPVTRISHAVVVTFETVNNLWI